jgi:hypothetical protein
MGKSHYLTACLLATAPLLAQGTLVSPSTLATVEGNGGAHYLLGYCGSRFQFAEGELRGSSQLFTEVAFRLDYRNHTPETAMGRKWTEVTLNVDHTDWTQMTPVFAENQLTTPMEVFRAAYDVPSVDGTPSVKPTPFGGKYAFPFSNPYPYNGTDDLLLDFVFLGGTLANSAAWDCGNLVPYYLDGNNDTTTYISARTTYPVTGPNPPCRDSAIVQNYNAYTFADLMVHGITHPNVMLREKTSFEMYSYYTAPNARIISAIGFAGIRTGVDVGARCNLLYLNWDAPAFFVARTTVDSRGFSSAYDVVAPWDPKMANMQVWVQTAWDDSKLNFFSLTQAMMVEMPSELPTPRRMVCTYSYLPGDDTGFNPETGSVYLNPIARYTYK